MLGKLLKYEFKATGRVLVPVYGLLIVLAALSRSSLGLDKINNENILGHIFQSICITAYIFTMAAVSIGTLIIIIQRFYKNLLGDEGYLMNTLPVKAWHNITSKLITGTVWTFLSGVVGVISILIMAKVDFSVIATAWKKVEEIFGMAYNEYGAAFVWTIIEIIVLMVISLVSSIIHIYVSIAIGHMAEKRKVLASLGAYIGTSIVINVIVSQITSIFAMNSDTLNYAIGNSITVDMASNYAVLNKIFLYLIIIQLIITIVCFFVTNYILNKKLNLE